MNRKNKKKIVIGVTGGVATGKSAAVEVFRRLGSRVVDADRIARDLTRPGTVQLKRIKTAFGSRVFAGQKLDRKKLADQIFPSPAKRRRLEKILHPAVIREMKRQIGRVKRGVVVVEIPLLFEAGLERMVDAVVVVWAPRRLQLKRLCRGRGDDGAGAMKRIRSQWPLSVKIRRADQVLRNAGTRGMLAKQVKNVWKKLLTR